MSLDNDPRGNPIHRCGNAARIQCERGLYQCPDPEFIGDGKLFLAELEASHELVDCKIKHVRWHIRHCVRCDQFSSCREVRNGT